LCFRDGIVGDIVFLLLTPGEIMPAGHGLKSKCPMGASFSGRVV